MTRITSPADSLDNRPGAVLSNGKTVLVAEDDPFISRMYETKLTNSGYYVVLANNGRDAYEKIKDTKPDLLLLDINMPELSGFEVLGALNGDGYDMSTTPVMVLTNSSNMADRKVAESYGAEYMIKAELTPRAVLERINAKLGIDAPGTAVGQ